MVDFFSNPENFRLIGLIVLISSVILLGLGMTGRVVIYNDGYDLALNFGIILIPLAAFLYVSMGAPPKEAGEAARISYYAQTWIDIAYIGSIIASAICFLLTTKISIRENGYTLGILIAILKTAIATIVFILLFLWFFSQEKKHKRPILSTILFLGILGGVMTHLINGEKVRARRRNQTTQCIDA